MFDPMSIIVPIVFIIVIGIIIFSLGQGFVTWNKNDQSPKLTVSAIIVAKRENITHHQYARLVYNSKELDKMKKKNITLVFVAIVFSIIVGMIIGKSLLKYKEDEPDVVGSFSMNRDENLTVVANRKNISDKEAFARLLLKMYKENSFHSIKLSTDHGYATSLDMTVYSWKEDIENGESIMQIEFRPIEYGKDYDIVNNPDKYMLFIDGKEIK